MVTCEEIMQLKCENETLKCKCKEADTAKSEMESLVVGLQDRIKVLERNIQFLNGEIEAYRYCISNKR